MKIYPRTLARAINQSRLMRQQSKIRIFSNKISTFRVCKSRHSQNLKHIDVGCHSTIDRRFQELKGLATLILRLFETWVWSTLNQTSTKVNSFYWYILKAHLKRELVSRSHRFCVWDDTKTTQDIQKCDLRLKDDSQFNKGFNPQSKLL